MNFKSLNTCVLFASIVAVGLTVPVLSIGNSAQASTVVYNEIQTGDPSRNDSSATPDPAIGDPNGPLTLATTGDNLIINGTLQGQTDTDWFQFTLNELASLSTAFNSSHLPPSGLQAFLYRTTDLVNPLQTLNFTTPGGTGGVVAGTFATGTQFLVHIVGDGSTNPDYAFTVEAQPVPTPALLPGLIGMGLAALRKRNTEAAAQGEAEV